VGWVGCEFDGLGWAMLCYAKTSKLGRRKCQSTTRAPDNVVSVKSTIEKNVFNLLFKNSSRMNATKRWWQSVPCAGASRSEWPVAERWHCSWHCDCAGCSRSEMYS